MRVIRIIRVPFSWRDPGIYRNELYGASALSIILYHYFKYFRTMEAPNKVIYFLAKNYNFAIGSIGVDIFVILSGYGIYYSLSRKGKISSFYSRRFKRVVVPYLICGLFYWTIRDFLLLHESFGQFVLDYTLISFWISNAGTFWYVSFIFVLYIFSPLLFWIADDRRRLIIGVLCSVCLSVLCYRFAHNVFINTEIAIQRVPYFMIGMGIGKIAKNMDSNDEEGIPLWLACVFACSVLVKIIARISRFPFERSFSGYYAIFLIIIYVLLRKAIADRWKALFPIISVLGKYSLEIYCVHAAVKNLMSRMGFPLQNPLVYLLHVAIVIPLVPCLIQAMKIPEMLRIRANIESKHPEGGR